MSLSLELRLEARRNGRLDAPCVTLLEKAAKEIELLDEENKKLHKALDSANACLSGKFILTNWFCAAAIGFIIGSVF